MRISVDRNVIVPAGAPPNTVGMAVTDAGEIAIDVVAEGVRVVIAMTSDEAIHFGVGAISLQHEARLKAAQRVQRPPSIVGPNGQSVGTATPLPITPKS